jgi:hypothetical protein
MNEKQEKFLQVYPESRNIEEAAGKVGVSRDTIYRWLRENPDMAASYLVEKFVKVEDIVQHISDGARGYDDEKKEVKLTMPQLAAAQYVLGTFLPAVFGRYKEQRKEGKITKVTVKMDTGKGTIETEEYKVKEVNIASDS